MYRDTLRRPVRSTLATTVGGRSRFRRARRGRPRRWNFARKGAAYIALYSRHPAEWSDDGVELRADSPDNVWICEMGSEAQSGDFSSFCNAISDAAIESAGLEISYMSPSVGAMRFGWAKPLVVAGNQVPLHDYPRYDNAFCHAAIGNRHFTVEYGCDRLEWDFTRKKGV